jgi:hypothetical protein
MRACVPEHVSKMRVRIYGYESTVRLHARLVRRGVNGRAGWAQMHYTSAERAFTKPGEARKPLVSQQCLLLGLGGGEARGRSGIPNHHMCMCSAHLSRNKRLTMSDSEKGGSCMHAGESERG